MKEFNINDGSKKFTFRLPTSIKEITNDYLLSVTDDIHVAPYHAVIATIYRCKLAEVIASNKKSRAMAIAIVPTFVKASITDKLEIDTINMFANLSCGDRLIIAGTDIERGYHLATPKNLITIDNLIKIYNTDKDFAKSTFADNNYYYFVEFKLVPITDIKGYYKTTNNEPFVNPFMNVIDDVN